MEQNLPASPVQGEVARSKISQPPLCKGRWHGVPEGGGGGGGFVRRALFFTADP